MGEPLLPSVWLRPTTAVANTFENRMCQGLAIADKSCMVISTVPAYIGRDPSRKMASNCGPAIVYECPTEAETAWMTVSTLHGTIVFDSSTQKVLYEDKSSNGTCINGVKQNKVTVEVEVGDVFLFDSTGKPESERLRFVVEKIPESVRGELRFWTTDIAEQRTKRKTNDTGDRAKREAKAKSGREGCENCVSLQNVNTALRTDIIQHKEQLQVAQETKISEDKSMNEKLLGKSQAMVALTSKNEELDLNNSELEQLVVTLTEERDAIQERLQNELEDLRGQLQKQTSAHGSVLKLEKMLAHEQEERQAATSKAQQAAEDLLASQKQVHTKATQLLMLEGKNDELSTKISDLHKQERKSKEDVRKLKQETRDILQALSQRWCPNTKDTPALGSQHCQSGCPTQMLIETGANRADNAEHTDMEEGSPDAEHARADETQCLETVVLQQDGGGSGQNKNTESDDDNLGKGVGDDACQDACEMPIEGQSDPQPSIRPAHPRDASPPDFLKRKLENEDLGGLPNKMPSNYEACPESDPSSNKRCRVLDPVDYNIATGDDDTSQNDLKAALDRVRAAS